MAEGDKKLGGRLDELEGKVSEHNSTITKARVYVSIIIMLAALIPVSAFGVAFFKKGEDGDDGRPGRDGISAPIGAVMAWPSSADLPGDRWMICKEGATADFNAELWDALAGLYDNIKKEDGTPEKIKLPDFQGMFLRGAGGKAPHLGGEFGKMQSQSIQKHAHRGVIQSSSNTSEPLRQTKASSTEGDSTSQDAVGGNMDDITKQSGEEETRPANYAVHWIIRVK